VDAVPDADLVAAARAGDSVAAGAFFARHFSYLRVMARRVAGSGDHAEDLLGGAMARLLELWARGEGPAENVLTYLVAAMRNRVIDEQRSPRARELWVEEMPESALISEADSLRVVDLQAEFGLVRRAFDRLAPDARRALQEVVVNGRPPREVAAEMGRSAGAVSTLVTRAKEALRRELLVVMLGEGREECAVNAETLPSRVLDSPVEHPAGAPGLAHVLGCVDCRAVWARYATLTSALGVIPLLSLGLAVSATAPPASAATGAAATPDGITGGSHAPDAKAAPTTLVAAAAAAPGAGVDLVGSGAGAGAAAGGAAAAVLARIVEGARAVVVGRAGIVVVVVALTVGAGLLVAALLGATGVVALPGSSVVPIAAVDAPAAHLRTAVTPYPDGTVDLEVDFEVEADAWSLVSFSITLPDTVRITSASGGWSCPSSDGGDVCTLAGAVPVSSRFTLTAEDVMPEDGIYLVELEALAEGVTTTGYSRGPLPAPEPTPAPSP